MIDAELINFLVFLDFNILNMAFKGSHQVNDTHYLLFFK
jgi:hypothetical protein